MSGAQVSGKVSNGSETAEARAAFYNGALSMDMLAGTDGRRTGVYCGATAQVSLFEAQADSSSTYSLPDLVPGLGDYDIKIGKTVGWSFGLPALPEAQAPITTRRTTGITLLDSSTSNCLKVSSLVLTSALARRQQA